MDFYQRWLFRHTKKDEFLYRYNNSGFLVTLENCYYNQHTHKAAVALAVDRIIHITFRCLTFNEVCHFDKIPCLRFAQHSPRFAYFTKISLTLQ